MMLTSSFVPIQELECGCKIGWCKLEASIRMCEFHSKSITRNEKEKAPYEPSLQEDLEMAPLQ